MQASTCPLSRASHWLSSKRHHPRGEAERASVLPTPAPGSLPVGSRLWVSFNSCRMDVPSRGAALESGPGDGDMTRGGLHLASAERGSQDGHKAVEMKPHNKPLLPSSLSLPGRRKVHKLPAERAPNPHLNPCEYQVLRRALSWAREHGCAGFPAEPRPTQAHPAPWPRAKAAGACSQHRGPCSQTQRCPGAPGLRGAAFSAQSCGADGHPRRRPPGAAATKAKVTLRHGIGSSVPCSKAPLPATRGPAQNEGKAGQQTSWSGSRVSGEGLVHQLGTQEVDEDGAELAQTPTPFPGYHTP